MFILLEKHNKIVENLKIENNKIVENLKIENNKIVEENNKIVEENNKIVEENNKLTEKNKNFEGSLKWFQEGYEKRLYEELADHISWYKKLEKELLNSSEEIIDKHIKESKNIVKSFIFDYLLVKDKYRDLNRDIYEIRQKTLNRENLFDKYIRSLRVFADYDSESFYQMNYSSDIEKHRTFYITFLEQIDKLKTEIEALKQELATQVANNITLVNELKGVK
jgi:N-terminal acetyltransferase B complex non-catalytic subunit